MSSGQWFVFWLVVLGFVILACVSWVKNQSQEHQLGSGNSKKRLMDEINRHKE